MERQLLAGPCSKENDGVIRRFMTSEHAASRYVVLHGDRSHTRNASVIIQTIQADGMKVEDLRGEPPGYSQADLLCFPQQHPSDYFLAM